MAGLVFAGALAAAAGAPAQDLDLSTVAGQIEPGAQAQMGETKGGDLKEFSAVTDEDIGTLEVGDIYKNNASFFKVTKVSRKGKKGGRFVVQRTSGENSPTRTWTRVSGLGPITVSSRETLWTLYLAGGGIMHPIAMCMVLVIVIAINGLFVFRRKVHCSPAFIAGARAALQKGDIAGFRSLCAGERGLLGRVCGAMTDDSEGADWMALDEMQTRAEMEANKQINFLRIPLKTLSVVAAVSPMLGLLGTVVGMVRCFESIAMESASASKALVLASGIRVALFTTVAGLVVAIPAMIVLFLLNQKLNGITSDCEIVASRFAHIMAKSDRAVTERK